jgi:4-amino-4-deoxy-L-arabinose transferase-like glycosyltransferase
MVISLLAGLLPWSLALAWSGIARLRGVRLDRAGRFLHAWWLVVLVVFTLAAGKRAVYLLPACPAVALVAARHLRAVVHAPGGAARWLDRVPAPARLRRWCAPCPRLAPLVLALALFDVGALVLQQTTREIRSRRSSLVAFAAEVRWTVPADATLVASGLTRDETLVLAYRLARALPRADATPPAAGTYYLVPVAARAARAQPGDALLAESHRTRGANVALMRTNTP